MAEAILNTKLYFPPTRPSLVVRPRLLERLTAGADGRLTLVSAPAGFGKTTLVAEWARLVGQNDRPFPPRPFCWLSLDENDNNPQRFFTYLLAAMQTVYPDLGQGLFAGLISDTPPDEQAIVPALVNELAAVERPLIVILDDFHAIDNPAVHAALAALIDYLPPAVLIVITSRQDPPLPLPRWRVRGQLAEVHAADLRFTAAEAGAFFQETMGLNLAETAVAALEKRTEGWVAGLQLAALSLRDAPDTAEFLAEFAGSQRQIADYLLQEVLLNQPPDIQQFLLRTAVLERFNAALTANLLDRADTQDILERLERDNLFLVPLDNHRGWYRYHHLFAQLLRYQLLRETTAAQVAALHRQAAGWFAEHELLDEAIHHALLIPDFDYAGALIAAIPPYIIYEQGGLSLIKQWTAALPPEVLRRYPQACVLAISVRMIRGEMEDVYGYLEAIDGEESTQPHQALFQAIFVRNRESDYERALMLAQDALRGLPPEESNMRAVARMQIAVNQSNLGRVAEAIAILEELRRELPAGDPAATSMLVQAIHLQASLARVNLDYVRVEELSLEGIDLANNRPGQKAVPLVGLLYASLARVYYEWNELDRAEEALHTAQAWGERTGITDIVFEAGLVGLDLASARGDKQRLQDLLVALKEFVTRSALQEIIDYFAVVSAYYQWRSGDLDRAVRWANAASFQLTDQPSYVLFFEYLTLGTIRLAESRALGEKRLLPQIIALAEGLAEVASAAQYDSRMLLARLLQALALDELGDGQGALAVLTEALALGTRGTLTRTYLDWGPPLRDLLAKGVHLAPHEVGRLLRAFDQETAVQPTPAASETAVLLTPREAQILAQLAAGLSNKEIESALFISNNTVRTHLKNLYSKLDAGSRAEALQRAAQLGLL